MALKLIEFKTGKEIKVLNKKELKELLKLCNPKMMTFYKKQLKGFEITGFGEEIKIERVEK